MRISLKTGSEQLSRQSGWGKGLEINLNMLEKQDTFL